MSTLINQSQVPGVHLQVTAYDNSPALDGLGHLALLDGYLEIVVLSDGTNPFYLTASNWRTLLVQIDSTTDFEFEQVDNTTVLPIFPTDKISEILLVEDSLQLDDGAVAGYGLWQIIRIMRDGTDPLDMIILCKDLGESAQQQNRFGGN